jgi:hypothetical protein
MSKMNKAAIQDGLTGFWFQFKQVLTKFVEIMTLQKKLTTGEKFKIAGMWAGFGGLGTATFGEGVGGMTEATMTEMVKGFFGLDQKDDIPEGLKAFIRGGAFDLSAWLISDVQVDVSKRASLPGGVVAEVEKAVNEVFDSYEAKSIQWRTLFGASASAFDNYSKAVTSLGELVAPTLEDGSVTLDELGAALDITLEGASPGYRRWVAANYFEQTGKLLDSKGSVTHQFDMVSQGEIVEGLADWVALGFQPTIKGERFTQLKREMEHKQDLAARVEGKIRAYHNYNKAMNDQDLFNLTREELKKHPVGRKYHIQLAKHDFLPADNPINTRLNETLTEMFMNKVTKKPKDAELMKRYMKLRSLSPSAELEATIATSEARN